MGRKLLKTVQIITTYRNPLADPMGTRRGPSLVRGPQFENRSNSLQHVDLSPVRSLKLESIRMQCMRVPLVCVAAAAKAEADYR